MVLMTLLLARKRVASPLAQSNIHSMTICTPSRLTVCIVSRVITLRRSRSWPKLEWPGVLAWKVHLSAHA